MSNLSKFVTSATTSNLQDYVVGELTYLSESEKLNVPANGFLKCDGSVASKSTYTNLSNIFTTPYPDLFDTKTYVINNYTEMKDLIYNGTYYFGANLNAGIGGCLTSTDGVTWNQLNIDAVDGFVPYAVAASTGTYVIVGDGTTYEAYTTTNPVSGTFTRVSLGSAAFFCAIRGSNLFVAGGGIGSLYTSINGTTWTARTSGTTSVIYALTYGNGIYVYGGQNGVLATSTNATTWTAQTSGTSSTIRTLSYGNGLYVYGGTGGVLATSTDAITWTARTSETTDTISRISFDNNTFVYHTTSEIGISADGINWNKKTVEADIKASVLNGSTLLYSNGSTSNVVITGVFSYDPATEFLLPNTSNSSSDSLYIKY